jgi:hypothetical protein
MPPKRKLKDVDEDLFDKYFDEEEEIIRPLIEKKEEIFNYMKKEYNIDLDSDPDEMEPGGKTSNSLLRMNDRNVNKYMQQLNTINNDVDDYFKKQAAIRDKEMKNVASDIIKRNVKPFLKKKKIEKAATTIQKMVKKRLRSSIKKRKETYLKNLPVLAKTRAAILKRKINKPSETANQKEDRLKKTAQELMLKEREKKGKAIIPGS